ncbi:uncharacterized protein LOC125769372 [Anopheles funestus]|uniref:uncharacterized protein LOC125762993 n=2 Tax=Anopheles funestus TaxID=62324 RepID=UPI0020C73AF6|nr:uncharacterized protein LOC125762993 [Anopheles funestus]XP_049294027.1 uncharacterized protein LOC125769372 [Anopheles funestus]
MEVLAAVKSLTELKKITEDEQRLVRLLQEAEILPSVQLCNKCNRRMKLKTTRKANSCKWICKPTSSCTGWECTVRTDSIFKNSRLSLSKLIEITYEWSRDTKRSSAAAECGAGKSAIAKWFSILREVTAEHFECSQGQIGGDGLTVEIDESVLTKRKYNRGRVSANNQVWVVGGICRETREIFLELVEQRDAATLHRIINQHVAPGTTIVTDGWRAYNGIDQHGFIHETINHSQNFVDPSDPFVHTQNIENLWRWVKPFIRSKGTKRGVLIKYIREYEMKRQNQNSFLSVLQAIKAVQDFA